MHFSRGNKIFTVDGKLTATATQYIYRRVEEPSHIIREGSNFEGTSEKGGTEDSSSSFVGDVEARVSPCEGTGR